MVTLQICGIPVDFPFQPYDSQLIYMEKVIVSLMSKQNAILESPTGTGKTLCLLCATLAWRRHMAKTLKKATVMSGGTDDNTGGVAFLRRATNGSRVTSLMYEGYEDSEYSADTELSGLPRIIYSSRTHSQLKQVVQELKNTQYRPNVMVLGSREHLCVNEKISRMRGTRQNLACRSAVKAKKCIYKNGFDSMARQDKKMSLPIMDIEELVETMKEKKMCPFFLSRKMIPDADIIFVPYNYLIDPLARRSIGISIENSILIFDEAHNVESIASESSSYALSSNDIAGCVAEVQEFIQALSADRITLPLNSSLTVESAETLKALLLEIDKGLNAFPLSSSGGFTKPGEYIFEFFQQFNVNFNTCPLVLGIIEEIIDVANDGNDAQRASSKLDALLSFLSTIFRNEKEHLLVAKNYRVHVQEVHDRSAANAPRLFNAARKDKSTTRVFNYWCFHPGVSFREICSNDIYNVVLTSGTLSPLETTIKELGIEFPVRLENTHVIDSGQVWVGVVGTGVTGKRLNSSYNFRSTDEYLLELGNTIVNFTRLVPSGLLVFFPSYGILEESLERWKLPANSESKASIWDRIVQQKQAFVEPRARLDFKAVVEEYHEAIAQNSSGAIFFAVCRGKVSEGIDFSNDKGRAVVITGLPFPPTKDPKIILKKSILDEATVQPGELKLTGNDWYIQQASRAVNQAIGRVIRHRYDYGAIILCDERFALQQQQKCISKWLQPYCHTCRSYGEAHIGLTRFFKTNKANAPVVPAKPEVTTVMHTKTMGLSRKALTKSREGYSQESVEKSQVTMMSKSSHSSTAIGDGQSYVNPELLRQAPDTIALNKPVDTSSAPFFPRRMSETASRKRTLGSVLSTSNSAMVETTSSISRPFVPPRTRVSIPHAGNTVDLTVEKVTPWQVVKQTSAGSEESTNAKCEITAHGEQSFVSVFPAVARKILPETDVTKLYGFIRQIHSGKEIDFALTSICELLKSPECQELLDLLAKVFNGSVRNRFIEMAESVGLRFSTTPSSPGQDEGSTVSNVITSDQRSASTMSSFFEKLQHKKRRKNAVDGHHTSATIVKDPQCFVCYEITRKAYASQCGHICCLSCWKKACHSNVLKIFGVSDLFVA